MPKQKSIRKFAMVEKEILYSNAWTELTHSARVVYFHLKGEFTGKNGDCLKLPYLEPRKGFGPLRMKDVMSRAAFYEGIAKLEEIGFIDRMSPGRKTKFKRGDPKTPARAYIRFLGVGGYTAAEYKEMLKQDRMQSRRNLTIRIVGYKRMRRRHKKNSIGSMVEPSRFVFHTFLGLFFRPVGLFFEPIMAPFQVFIGLFFEPALYLPCIRVYYSPCLVSCPLKRERGCRRGRDRDLTRKER